MYRLFAALLLFALTAGCGADAGRSAARVVTVAAASDLRHALAAVIRGFHEIHPDIEVQPTFAASGTLHAQIATGAPFDLFLAADIGYAESLAEQGLAARDDVFRYGTGRLVVWVPQASAVDLDAAGIQALLDPAIRRIAIANPRHAPYGRAAEAAIDHYRLRDLVQVKLVLGENVAEAAQFVASGAADAAVVARALAESPVMKPHGRAWLVPADAHPPLVHGGAVLAAARDAVAARLVVDFVRGSEGRAILRDHGFDVEPN
ncbi:MAG: molybdate ABC transporter substrate-binding protein [Pirellulales bacterium]